jgi:amino acid adenylation domain-containing protein
MSAHPQPAVDSPRAQQLIRARCVHPTGTFVEFTKAEIEQSIPARFEQQVREYPDRLAIKTRSHALTYAELNQVANRVARAILALRGRGEEPIALLLDKDAPLIATIFGVLKAGKIYVPLDLSFPRDRLTAMLEEVQAGVIVTDDAHCALAQTLAPAGCQVLNIEAIKAGYATENVDLAVTPDTLACILYTSGSTGRPKGVVHNHRTILHLIAHYTNSLRISTDDRLTLLYPCGTMGGLRDTFSALLNGASLHPFDIQEEGLEAMAGWLIGEEITILNAVVTLFRHFVGTLTGMERFPTLRLVKFGGEQAARRDVELFKRYFPAGCLLYLGLGTTETFSFGEYWIDTGTPVTWDVAPAGYTVEDLEVLLLDEDGTAVGVNQVGEIAVRSRYLALGYWHRPDLTRASFLPDPRGGDARIYRTGDLGRLRPDGCLEHLGRKDFQVKIRGHRVEVAEIERVLLGHEAVKEAVVVSRGTPAGDPCLVAYLIPAQSPPPSISALRRVVQAQLPGYMVPAAFVFLDALPLTPNGKVDRRALPAPDPLRPKLDTPFVAPRTPVEEELAGIWAAVLGLDQVGIHDNFLELGGHSLLAAQIVTRVRDIFHLEVPLRTLLEAPTVADMAVVITQYLVDKVEPADLDRLLAEVEGLSEDELQRRLAGEVQ